jgi:DNA-binding CsgD family transcriptional regulator
VTYEKQNFHTVASSPRFVNAVDRLSRLQTELVSEALRRAVDDVNAAMAHQLGEPLTALLLYLHEIKQIAARPDATDAASVSLRAVTDMALREAERICGMIEQAAKFGETPTGAEAAVARGREAIDMWAWDCRAKVVGAASSVVPLANPQPLTPREQEVLGLVIDGSSNKEGGHRLGISTRTFEAHRARLMGKLGARNTADLIRKTTSRSE